MAVQSPEATRSAAPASARQPEPKEAAEPAPVPAGSPGLLSALMPLAIAVVVMPLLAYGVTSFVLVPRLQHALRAAAGPTAESAAAAHEAPAAPKEAAAKGGPRQSVAFNKLLVNVAGTMGSRYLLTSLTLSGGASDFTSRVGEKEPQLRDMASGLLSLKTIADLEKPGVRNQLRGELIAGFNSILGDGQVQEIYFTEFAIQ